VTRSPILALEGSALGPIAVSAWAEHFIGKQKGVDRASPEDQSASSDLPLRLARGARSSRRLRAFRWWSRAFPGDLFSTLSTTWSSCRRSRCGEDVLLLAGHFRGAGAPARRTCRLSAGVRCTGEVIAGRERRNSMGPCAARGRHHRGEAFLARCVSGHFDFQDPGRGGDRASSGLGHGGGRGRAAVARHRSGEKSKPE
jgi:hypothetical protein